MKIFSLLFLMIGGLSLVGCNCDDIADGGSDWDQVPANPQLQGHVQLAGTAGTYLKGVTITLTMGDKTLTATTDENGFYSIENLEVGNYPVTASLVPGNYNNPESTAELEMDKVTVVNFLMWEIPQTTATVSEKGGGVDNPLPNIIEEDKTANTPYTHYEFPAGSVDEDEVVDLESDYELQLGSSTRAFNYYGTDVMITSTIRSKSGKTQTKKPIRISAHFLSAPYKVIHNGKEVSVTIVNKDNATDTYFETQDLGTTQFYFKIYKSDAEDSKEDITFSPSTFSGYATNVQTSYSYKSGSEIVPEGNFLDEFVPIIEGSLNMKTVNTTVNILKTIPAGEKAILYGYQWKSTYKYQCGWAECSVVQYGSVFYDFKDRLHTGGSN